MKSICHREHRENLILDNNDFFELFLSLNSVPSVAEFFGF